MGQIVLSTDSISKLKNVLSGKKTYITLVAGMAVIALNHFGLLPESLTPEDLDPKNWVSDEYKLVVAAFLRSGVAKVGAEVKNGKAPV